MGALSQNHAMALLTSSLRGSTVYLALYNSEPTPADSGTEVSGGSYARQAISFSAPALVNGVATTSNSAAVSFPRATTAWGSVPYWGIRTANTGGTLLWQGSFTQEKSVDANDTITIYPGEIVIDLK